MDRRDFLKLSAAPIAIPWVADFSIKRTKELEEAPTENEIKYDTLTVKFDVTDDLGNQLDLQSTYEAYAIFKSPSGKFHTVKCDLNRNSVWRLTTVSASINLIESGWWDAQLKLILPGGTVYLTKTQRYEAFI